MKHQNSIRVINGFIEIEYERFAQVLPNKDERTLREELLGIEDDYDLGYEEGREDGYQSGQDDGYEAGKQATHDEVDAILDKLVLDNVISPLQAQKIGEALDE